MKRIFVVGDNQDEVNLKSFDLLVMGYMPFNKWLNFTYTSNLINGDTVHENLMTKVNNTFLEMSDCVLFCSGWKDSTECKEIANLASSVGIATFTLDEEKHMHTYLNFDTLNRTTIE